MIGKSQADMTWWLYIDRWKADMQMLGMTREEIAATWRLCVQRCRDDGGIYPIETYLDEFRSRAKTEWRPRTQP